MSGLSAQLRFRMRFRTTSLNAGLTAIGLALPSVALADGSGASGGPGLLMNAVPILFMVGVFYFLIMRPQMRKQKELQTFLANLKHGDSVFTAGGMLGVIREIQGAIVTLEVSQGTRIKFLRSQIAQSADRIVNSEAKA